MKSFIFSFFLIFCFTNCVPYENDSIPSEVLGLKPIYVPEQDAITITAQPPRAIERLGKIYYKDKTIYVNESNMGVHVIDNTDPANPVKTKFLNIPGCRDIAIKGHYLYADNAGDLVTIDISDIDNPVVKSRIKNVQGFISQSYPEFYEGYFECVDEGKGIVIGWEEAMLKEPKCWK